MQMVLAQSTGRDSLLRAIIVNLAQKSLAKYAHDSARAKLPGKDLHTFQQSTQYMMCVVVAERLRFRTFFPIRSENSRQCETLREQESRARYTHQTVEEGLRRTNPTESAL